MRDGRPCLAGLCLGVQNISFVNIYFSDTLTPHWLVLLYSRRSSGTALYMAARGGKEDYYNILGVDRKADKATIKKVYKKLAMKNHPDVNKDPGAKDTFIKINEAYAVLSDEKKRRQYDLGYACAVVAALRVVFVMVLSQTANTRLAHTTP